MKHKTLTTIIVVIFFSLYLYPVYGAFNNLNAKDIHSSAYTTYMQSKSFIDRANEYGMNSRSKETYNTRITNQNSKSLYYSKIDKIEKDRNNLSYFNNSFYNSENIFQADKIEHTPSKVSNADPGNEEPVFMPIGNEIYSLFFLLFIYFLFKIKIHKH